MEYELNNVLACLVGVMGVIIVILIIAMVIMCNSSQGIACKPYPKEELDALDYEKPNKVKLNEINMVGCRNEKEFKVYNVLRSNKN